MNRYVHKFIETGGGLGIHAIPPHDAVVRLIGDMSRVAGEEVPESSVFVASSLSDPNDIPPHELLMDQQALQNITEFPYTNVAVRRIGSTVIRTIGFAQEKDLPNTSEYVGMSNRLMLICQPVDERLRRSPQLVYGIHNQNANTVSNLMHTVNSVVVLPESFARLERALDRMGESATDVVGDIPDWSCEYAREVSAEEFMARHTQAERKFGSQLTLSTEKNL
jgi:hypothetical protein